MRKIIRIIVKDIIPLLIIVAISVIGALYIIIDDIAIRCQLYFLFVVIAFSGSSFVTVSLAISKFFDELCKPL